MQGRKTKRRAALLFVFLGATTTIPSGQSQKQSGAGAPTIPKTWDDAEMVTLEVPLADPVGSPKHVSADYYYKIPVRPIYKQYPIYAPGHEPAGYMEWLKRQNPEVIWDDRGHAPSLKTDADRIKAGEIVFDSPIGFDSVREVSLVRSAKWYEQTRVLIAKDGTIPYLRYVVREKGKVEVAERSCASCHTRVMPDGSMIKGAQGNFAFDHDFAFELRPLSPEIARNAERFLFAVPWLRPDPLAPLAQMPAKEIASLHDAIPPGVLARHRSSPFYPVQVPDLIGVEDRRYLDRTGLQQHRSIADLMRYAALNQGGDDLASFDGFIPNAAPPWFRTLPKPDDPTIGGRYSDEQLYALALYICAPTGLKGSGVKTRAVKGHEFGLDLPDEDHKALIAFLKTL